MLNQLKSLLRQTLEHYGYTIKRTGLGYLDASKTLAAAQQANLSVGDYVEQLWDKVGEAERVIGRVLQSPLPSANPHIVEIGPGTGRYLSKVLTRLQPQQYAIYETDAAWARWLSHTYPVMRQPADGMSLRATPAHSVDFIHAHGVFVYLPFLTTWRYWQEIWRVTRAHGIVAFDVFSEHCFGTEDMQRWLASGETYPCFLATDYVIEAFAQQGFQLLDQFLSPCCEGHSEYLVFQRHSTDAG